MQPRFREPILGDAKVVAAVRLFRNAMSLLIAGTHAPRTVDISQIDRRRIAMLIDYLAANLDQSASLNELATLANVSPDHLIRLFSAATGAPPHAYLNALRMQRAHTPTVRRAGCGSAAAATLGRCIISLK